MLPLQIDSLVHHRTLPHSAVLVAAARGRSNLIHPARLMREWNERKVDRLG